MKKQKSLTSADKRLKLITLAGMIALIGNLILAVAKLSVGFFTGSLAVISDGVDTATDVIIALMTLIISKIISLPSDKGHPWGHGRAETIGTMVLSFIIFFAGTQLAQSAIETLLHGGNTSAPSRIALIVTAVSVFGKILLAISQAVLGKKACSSMVRANAQNMINDIVTSGAVLLGLLGALVFDMPLLDPIAALAVSVWIIKNAVKIFWEMNSELMDGNVDNMIYEQLFTAIHSVEGVSNPHRVRIRKIASHWDITLDIEVPADMSVYKAHEKAEKVSSAIRENIPDVYDIVVHVEPAGREHTTYEAYGLKEDDV